MRLIRYVENLSLSDAVKFISSEKADYYIYHKASLLFFLKENKIKHLKIHPCCREPLPMYLGFSKRSKYASAVINTQYDKKSHYSPLNSEYILSAQSKAGELASVLLRLSQSGYIKKLEKKHFGDML